VKRWIFSLILVLLMVGCSSDSDDDYRPGPNQKSTPEPVVWQRPSSPITEENSFRVHLTGNLQFHQQTVNAVAFSPSGNRMASVAADNNTVIWNLANGESLVVRGENDGRRVFFGPTDDILVTINRDGIARVWQINLSPPGELVELVSFTAVDQPGASYAMSPDHSLLAAGGPDGYLNLWQIPDGTLFKSIQAHPQSILGLVFSPDGLHLASISLISGVRVWSVPAAEMEYDWSDPDLHPLHLAFSSDSQRLAVGYVNEIQVWDLPSGQQVYEIADVSEQAASNELLFSPDNTLLAACGAQNIVGIWDAAEGTFLGGLQMPENGACTNIIFSPDSQLLLSISQSGQNLYLWNLTHIQDDVPLEQKQINVATRDKLGLLPQVSFYDIAWSADGRFIVVLDQIGPMYVLSVTE